MKSKAVLIPSWILALSASLFLAASTAFAASTFTFTDTWKAAGAFDSENGVYFVKPSGTFTAKISLPLNGVDLSAANADSGFGLSIGPVGSAVTIVADNFVNAQSFSASKKTATFALFDPDTAAKIGTVTVSWTATTLNVTVSATADLLGQEAAFADGSDLTPKTTVIDSSVDGNYFEADVYLDTSPSGGGKFEYTTSIMPVKGSNKETEFNPPDDSGPYPLETGTITGVADTAPPVLSITAPAANFKVYDANPVINLTGKVSDNVSITEVQYYVNGDSENARPIDQADLLPASSLTWSASVDLSELGGVGTNLITVYASDSTGNHTTISRAYLWLETNAIPLSINPSNSGTVKGLKNGQVVQVGKTYPVTATAASKPWIFSSWTDGASNVLSYKSSFNFLDADTNASLVANFLPNPFYNTALAGTYTGLMYDTNNGVIPADAGYLTITVTPAGAYSGKVFLGAASGAFPLSGQFTVPDGTNAIAEQVLKLNKTIYMDVRLVLTTQTNLSIPPAGVMGGHAIFATDAAGANVLAISEIHGEISQRGSNIVSGLHTTVISPSSEGPSDAPGGYGFVSATVAKSGSGVTLGIRLADGTSPNITFTSALDSNGNCPLFASLYAAKGVVLGWLRFDTNGTGAVLESQLTWTKMPNSTKVYPNGFRYSPTVSGSLYVPPGPGTNVFGWTNGLFIADEGFLGLTLPDEYSVPVIFNPAKNTFSNTNKVTLNFTKATGALSGSFFFPPAGKTATAFSALTVGNTGFGFYTRSNQTGPITISMPAAPAVAPVESP